MACNTCRGNANLVDLSQMDYEKSNCTIGNNICKSCDEINDVEQDIAQTVKHLRNLLLRHQDLKTEANHVHSPIMDLLPVEIISKIFETCLERVDDEQDGSFTFTSLLHSEVGAPRMKLGAICRTWRQIAWSSPQLWKEVILVRCSPSERPDQYHMLDEWISRSKDLPLDLYLCEYADDVTEDEYGQATWHTCLDLLAQCANRWRTMDVYLQMPSFEYLSKQIQDSPPVQSIILRRDQRYHIDIPENYCLFHNHKLSPRSVSISGFFLQEIAINWEGVTNVYGENMSAEDCVELLKQAPQLQKCRFNSIHAIDVEDAPTTPLILRHQSLKYLSFASRDLCVQLFNKISLPGLTYFKCNLSPHDPLPDDPSLLPFFRRSSFSLTHLELTTGALTSGYLISILNTVPTLIHLRLDVSTYANEEDESVKPGPFLHYLAITAEPTGSVSFLPRLESLEYELYSQFPWTHVPDIFGQPSYFGTPNRRPLKSFVVQSDSLHHKIPRDVLLRIKELRDTGFIIKFEILGYDRIPLALEYHIKSEERALRVPESYCYSGFLDVHIISQELR